MTGLKSMGASLALAAAFAFSGAATAQEIKLTLADQNSATAWGPTNGMQPWIKQVEQATKGRVKIEVFASQTLLKGPDTWRGVSTGIADIGWCVQSYWPDLTPLARARLGRRELAHVAVIRLIKARAQRQQHPQPQPCLPMPPEHVLSSAAVPAARRGRTPRPGPQCATPPAPPEAPSDADWQPDR